jgi:hypothetical protein
MDKILAPIIELANIMVCLAFPDKKESNLIIFLIVDDSLVGRYTRENCSSLVANFK